MPRRLGSWLIAAGVAAAALAALLFRLPRLGEGPPLALADVAGKVVLMNFWATWCKPCEDEMPAMQRLYRALGDSDFELLAVSVDDDPQLVSDFAERLQLDFPILLDPGAEVAHSYQTYRYPETLLIGPDGVVVERFIGPRDWDAAPYVARIRRMLEDGPPGGA
jgi:peroxiredoxin